MTVRSAWHINPGQTRADTRLTPVGTYTPLDATQTRAGVIPGGTGLLLTGTGMTGTVAVGRAIVQGTATQGAYPVAITAAETITVANGHASLPRIDTVWLVAYDQLYDTSGQTLAAVVYTQGTAASTPAAPTSPATGTAYLRLWDILVPAGASAGAPITWATALSDRRTYTVAVGGINPGGTAVAGAYTGQWRDNSGVLERYSGAAWVTTLLTSSSAEDTASRTTTSVTLVPLPPLSATLTVPPSGIVKATLYVLQRSSSTGNAFSSFRATGSASGINFTETLTGAASNTGTNNAPGTMIRRLTGLTPGETLTLVPYHMVNGFTGTWDYRYVMLEALAA